MKPLTILYLTLATASVTIQTSPQAVQRLQEWLWCVTPERAQFIRRTTLVIDGRRTDPTDEALTTLEERDARFEGIGP